MSFTAQTTLTEDAPLILDATCSFARVWPPHATVRIDVRPEVKPDIVMDAGDLKFPDHYFDAIYCDPPHLIRADGDHFDMNSWLGDLKRAQFDAHRNLMNRYGFFKARKDWLSFIERTNREFYRCLKPSGLLHYKICEGRNGNKRMVKLSELLEGMTNFEVIKDRVTESKSRFVTKNPVHWLMMKPTAIEGSGNFSGVGLPDRFHLQPVNRPSKNRNSCQVTPDSHTSRNIRPSSSSRILRTVRSLGLAFRCSSEVLA